ncbi:LuxR C-terminal-related transcriptional regulator [Agromyces endophyticus]|uniref:helix-turn-helix transcriptional regulator n=1 Tax=Agromyces sp. H17E-10 TaxID=2932244 RepID=UPI001FD3449C|nr:LuxR family transcriptional regulator [Agromyces sp. H17E-10]UOQ88235.1 LuxR C-terminal-related transcriptional regulator [Agromyces sp. H17E-10]
MALNDPDAQAGPEPDLDGPWPLVGRDAQVARGSGALLGGQARAVFLYGPSGVGKSRIQQAIGEALDAAGWLVLTASGNPVLSAVPFATIAPAIARGVDDPVLPRATDQLTLFSATSATIAELAGGRRVVIAVDDLSSADSVSVALVAQLVAAGSLTLIATLPEGEPVPDGIMPIASSPDAVRIDVPALDLDEVTELVATVLGAPIAHRDAVELHRASHGNPLFLRELVIGAVETGTLVRAGEHWQLEGDPVGTPALRDLIRARLRGLGPEERDAIERLALCEPLGIDEFVRPGAPEALAELELRGMIRVDESGHGIAITLAHPQYAGAVRESLPRIRAISLLIEQADVVERGPMTVVDELRIAMWRLDAGRPSDPDLLIRSADLARRAHDHRTAERLAAAAIGAGATDASAHMLHAELLWSLGRGPEALTALDNAERSARDADEPEAAMLAAIATKRADIYGGDPLGSERGIRLLEEIGRALPEQLPMLLISKATLVLHLLRANEALALVDEAGGHLGDSPVERAIVSLGRAMPLSQMQRSAEAVAEAESALAYASGDGAHIPKRRAQIPYAYALIESDRSDDARRVTIEMLHDAIRNDDELTARHAEFLMGRQFWAVGRLDTAARWFRDSLSGAELRGPASLRGPSLGFLTVIACMQGDLVRARDLRERFESGYDREDTLTALADAWLARTDGDVDGAAEILLARVDQVLPRGANNVAASFLHTLARLGSRSHAAHAADRLESLERLTDAPEIARRARHARAEASGDAVVLRALGEEWERLGALLFAAEAFASAGQAARSDGRGREASADLQRAAALAAACEGARTPLLTFTDGSEPLTPREREIASLAAQGLSSNEIAQRLFLSPRTVNNHLQSTYTKLGIRGRRELQL